MTKAFDCVAMKHRGAEAVQARLVGLTVEEQKAWWQERTRELHREQERLRQAHVEAVEAPKL